MFLSAESLLNRQPGATRSHIVRSAIVGGPPVTVDGGLPSVRSEKRRVPGGQLPVISSQIGCLAGALSRSAARIGGWTGSEEAASITPANAATARW